MRLLPLLLLLLTACAAPSHTYRQGIPVAPSAPAFNPAWDAPHTTGQPGYVGPVESLPRSPHARVLPETPDTRREPGLWSGDQPRASDYEDAKDVEPYILGVRIPYINDPPPHEVETWPVRWCAAAAATAVALHVDDDAVAALSKEERECAAALMYAACAGAQRAETWAQRDRLSQRLVELIKAMQDRSAAFRDEKCNSDSRSPRVEDLVGALLKTWKRL